MADELVPTSLTIPTRLKERAEEIARQQDRSLSSLMRRALEAYLEEIERQQREVAKARS